MRYQIFTVKYITLKSCFCYLSERNTKYLQKGVAIEVIHNKKSYLFTAQPLISLRENEVGINRLHAEAVGLPENTTVMISARHNISSIARVVISPITIEDYEVLEILAENIQETLLNQLRVVNQNQKFIIWISNNLHLQVNVDQVEPVNYGRLENLTELEVAFPKSKTAEIPDEIVQCATWMDFLNPFKKSPRHMENFVNKYAKACYPLDFRLHFLSDLPQIQNLDTEHFNVYTDSRSLPKNVCSGGIYRLKIIIPPVMSSNFLEESSFDVKSIIVRLRLLESHSQLDYCMPLMYVHDCIFKHYDIKAGSKAFISDCVEYSPIINTIEISTDKSNLKKAITNFKLFVNKNCRKQKLLLNSDFVLELHGFAFSLKFLPLTASYCVVDSNLIRKCKFVVNEMETSSMKATKPVLPPYCEDYSNVREIIDNGLKLLELPATTLVEAENILIVGKTGSGKSTLTKIISDKLLAPSLYIYSETISCKAIKGKSLESLNKVFMSKITNLIYYQPSVLILDDIHIICEKVTAGEGPTPESLHFNRVSEMLANILDANLKTNRISIVATSASILKLNEHIFASRGQHFFKNVFEIEDLTKLDRASLLKFLFQLKCPTDCVDLDLFSQKTEGFVIQDLVDFVDKAVFECLQEENVNVTTEHCELALENSTALSLKDIQLHSPGDRDFSDVGGLEDVKKILVECMLWPVQYPNLFNNAPLRLQSGLLLYGPPGTGKTILAGAAAKHCSLRLISIKGPELLSKYIGASEEAVREVFEKAQTAKPCILFFDEFDSLAPRRGHDSTGVTDRVVNQLLTQLDGVESLSGVCVLAATSRPDLLDPALLRPGRLDRQILCALPNKTARLKILQSLSKKMKFAEDVELEKIAEKSVGYSGADLQAVLYTAQLTTVEEIGIEQIKVKDAGDVMEINQSCLEDALRCTRPSLTKEENLKYKKIYAKFQSGGGLVDIQSGPQKATLA